jgi:hypothetical protein
VGTLCRRRAPCRRGAVQRLLEVGGFAPRT